MKTREEIANELYGYCLEHIQPPPTLEDVKAALLFISLIMASNQNGEEPEPIPEDQRAGYMAGRKDALKKSFNDLVRTEADVLNNYTHAGAELLEAVRSCSAAYIDSWKDTDPAEVWKQASEELTAICSAAREIRTAAPFAPVRAKNLVRPNTLFANMLPELVNKGETQITTGRKKTKNPLTETVIVTMPPRTSDGITIEGDYTPMHEAVFCAFLSLSLSGNNAITASMIRRFLSQDFEANIAPATIKEIEDILADLRRMEIKADIREEAARRGFDVSNIDRLKNGEMMLMLRTMEVTIGGETKTAYSLVTTPLLYVHAQLLGQLQTFPAALLAVKDLTTGKRIRSTTNRTKIQIYLLQQIANIKSDLSRARKEWRTYESRRAKNPAGMTEKKLSSFRKMNDKILYQTIFDKTGLAGSQNKTLIEYKSYIVTCLDNWREAGQLKGYQILYDGRRKDVATGIRILLD